ncbi:MAG: creatininase family protein [Candidatus Methylacidiphilales bacterium]
MKPAPESQGGTLVWENLTWEEVPQALQRAAGAVLWPFGATEQHGPHLGLGVDTIIASRVSAAVSARTRVPVLPPMPIGCSLGHTRRWPGTLSLMPRTLAAVVVEVGAWLYAAGVRRLFMINAHVTNHAPLRCALEELRFAHPDMMIALINTADISPRVQASFFAEGPDWHANAAETSLMLYLHRDGCRPERCAQADDPDRTLERQFAHPVSHTSRNGVTGAPSQASIENGEKLFAQMVEDLSQRVFAGLQEIPPLEPTPTSPEPQTIS